MRFTIYQSPGLTSNVVLCALHSLKLGGLRALHGGLEAFRSVSRCCTVDALNRRTLRAAVYTALSLFLASDLARGRGEVQGA